MTAEKIFQWTSKRLPSAERNPNACANVKSFVNKSFRKYFLFEVFENEQ
jgi:hypothetical protein